ncbi:MAG: hypothetical protein PUB10_00095 [Clostridiales bacterium]|nr:hypothetical protein [Clostridiales bacterium]
MNIKNADPIANDSTNFTKLILELLREEGMNASLFSDGWVIQITYQGKTRYIHGYQFGLNSAAAANICNDKSTCSEILSANQIPNIPHVCFMSPLDMRYASRGGNWNTLCTLMKQYGSVICKNNSGTGGEEVYHAHSQLELEHYSQRIFATCPSMAVCPYYPLEHEYRVILLDGEMVLAYEKIRPCLTGDGHSTIQELYSNYLLTTPPASAYQTVIPPKDADRVLKEKETYSLNWKHNLGQGARANLLYDRTGHVKTNPEYAPLITSMEAMAKKAATATGIRFASIDLVNVKGENGLRVLEINSGVMMEYLSGQEKASHDIAKAIYREAIHKMFEL